MKVLLIDDEPVYFKQLLPATKKAGYELEYARSGAEGLAAVSAQNPELLVVDLRLEDVDGFEIIRRLRNDPRFSHIPVMVITGKDDLENKLKAFEVGADDFLVKPFQPEELVARLGILARRGKAMKYVQQMETDYEKTNTMVAIHSLRGGVGGSSLAVNLALGFYNVWNKSTLLVDGVLTAGQLAMMIDASPHATWEDFINMEVAEIDDDTIRDLVSQHKSGLRYIAAPRYPIAAEGNEKFWQTVVEKLRKQHEFIVVDTAHDFSDITITMLNAATDILLVMAPEMASLRASVSALNIYDRLGFPENKVKIVLNNNSPFASIKQPQLEKVLGHQIDMVVPYEANEVLRAINFGEPFMLKNTDLAISVAVENIAYTLSNDIHKNIPPAVPTAAWKRVTSRLGEKK